MTIRWGIAGLACAFVALAVEGCIAGGAERATEDDAAHGWRVRDEYDREHDGERHARCHDRPPQNARNRHRLQS